ncbi:hypothetical protein MBLNU13_g10656t1 [Cladosporium sp. NU13]
MKRFGSSKEVESEVKTARPWAEDRPAPGGIGTTEEGEGVPAARKYHRLRTPRAERRERARARVAASKASEVGPTDNNQGLPGSVEGGQPMRETEAGQSQQDEEDEIFKDPRIVALIARHNKYDDAQRAELADCRKSSDFRQREIDNHKETIRKQKAAIAQQERLAGDVSDDFENALQDARDAHAAAEDAKAAAEASNKRFRVSEDLMARMRNESIAITSALKEATEQKHQLEEQFDEAGVYCHELEDRIDDLERKLAAQQTVATENTTLKEEIAAVHSSFEDVFSDMAKGLTINEKFAYVREHQNTAPAGRSRIASTSSLHEELDDHSDAGSEHSKAPTREPLTFSGTESVEIAPASEHSKAPRREPLTFSGITVAETVPVLPATKPTTPLGFSGITSIDTAPAAPVVAPVKNPAPMRELFSFSGITSIETAPAAPVVAPVKKPAPTTGPLTFSGTKSVETAPVAPVVAPVEKPAPMREPFAFSGITNIETAPVAPVVAPIKKPAPEIRVQWRNRYITEHVDRPVVPWWMWLTLLIAIITCASGFAGLLRENLIWLDANDMAYQRLMGAEQETLLASVSMGVQDLLPSMGGMGHSLFG